MPSYPFANSPDGQSHTFDPACGRRVEHLLRAAGLTGVGTEGRAGI